MKLTDIWLLVVLTGILFLVAKPGIQNLQQASKTQQLLSDKKNAAYFISESFRRTCDGKGFSSLTEWQTACKELWNLQYIGWSSADSFMEVEQENKGLLYYGTWTGSCGTGEVYWRIKNETDK